MKTIFHLILVFTIVSTIKVSGQGIIIDHNCIDIDQIPVSVIDDIQAKYQIPICSLIPWRVSYYVDYCKYEEFKSQLYQVAYRW